jgi:hypothetical protein
MLAACAAFQTWIGAGVDPLTRIHLVELTVPTNDDEEQDQNFSLAEIQSRRPFALIWTPSEQPFSISIIASPNTPSQSGVLRIRLEENVDPSLEKNYPEAYRRFLNTIGQIIHSEDQTHPGLVELLGVCGPNYLNFNAIDILDHMRTSTDDAPTMGDAHKCELVIRWGGGV